MKKMFVFTILSVFISSISYACQDTDYEFKTQIIGLQIDFQKLKSICTAEDCLQREGKIIYRSHFNTAVAVILSEDSGTKEMSLAIRIPALDKGNGEFEVSTIDPKRFDWQEAVKVEFDFLSSRGIVKEKPADLGVVALLSEESKKVILCDGQWQKVRADQICGSIGIDSVRCGSMGVWEGLPQKEL